MPIIMIIRAFRIRFKKFNFVECFHIKIIMIDNISFTNVTNCALRIYYFIH